MAIEMTKQEIEILNKADDELAKLGKTEEKCPRCGNEIVIEEVGKSYSVKCKTPNCIHLDFRGI